MPYDLSPNERFFLNQVIPKWNSGKPFDLQGDLKYVFHREKGTNYDPAQFEYTLDGIRTFLIDHGFAEENPAYKYTFTLLSKGNSLLVKGSIEQFEFYQEQQKATGGSYIAPPAREPGSSRIRSEVFIPNEHQRGRSRGPSIITILFILVALAIVAWYYFNNNE